LDEAAVRVVARFAEVFSRSVRPSLPEVFA
jgi:hypothetical protein